MKGNLVHCFFPLLLQSRTKLIEFVTIVTSCVTGFRDSSCQGFVYSLDGLVSGHNSNEVEQFDPNINL